MNTIKFPLLNLNLNISKIALNILGIDIYWYAIIIVFAIIIALLWCKLNSKRYNIEFEKVTDLALIVLPASIISARLYYVLFNIQYYIQQPLEILNFRDGGLAIYGGIIGGIITCYILTKKYKINNWDFLDLIAPAVALAQSIGRWGNFINVEAYGTETNLPWKMGIIENGAEKFVHPTFLYESICTFLIFIILTKLQNKRKFKGEITYLYLIMYSFVRFFIEGLRIDSLMLFNFRISQILSLAIFAVITVIFIHQKIKSSSLSKKDEK